MELIDATCQMQPTASTGGVRWSFDRWNLTYALHKPIHTCLCVSFTALSALRFSAAECATYILTTTFDALLFANLDHRPELGLSGFELLRH